MKPLRQQSPTAQELGKDRTFSLIFDSFRGEDCLAWRGFAADGILDRILLDREQRIVLERSTTLDGQRHSRPGQPSIVRYYSNGALQQIHYHRNGHFHRKDGPAVIEYYDNGSVARMSWYVRGRLHRPGHPADVQWDVKGRVAVEFWGPDSPNDVVMRQRLSRNRWRETMQDGTLQIVKR